MQPYVALGGISLNAEKKQLGKGKTFQLKVVFYPKDATITDVTWLSSDPSVATVDTTGRVKALKKRKVQYTCIAADGSG